MRLARLSQIEVRQIEVQLRARRAERPQALIAHRTQLVQEHVARVRHEELTKLAPDQLGEQLLLLLTYARLNLRRLHERVVHAQVAARDAEEFAVTHLRLERVEACDGDAKGEHPCGDVASSQRLEPCNPDHIKHQQPPNVRRGARAEPHDLGVRARRVRARRVSLLRRLTLVRLTNRRRGALEHLSGCGRLWHFVSLRHRVATRAPLRPSQ